TTTSWAQSAYFNAITNLNPVGYWPMHEVAAPAPGNIETNYGTLGLLGAGYYPDWGSASVSFMRGVPGAITGDSSDTAVNFTRGANPAAGTYTDCLYVPHTSPLSTLNPPFSVECWFFPTNLQSKDIWAQCGDEGLNYGGKSGQNQGALAGVRLTWMNGTNTGFQIFNLDGGQNSPGFVGNVGGVPAYPLNQWYHLVLTCDASTNFSLAVNGSVVAFNPAYTGATANGPGTYTPDYWTPISIGGGRGGTRAVAGYIDEFAVYTNVLGDIGTHYNDGGSGGAGVYLHDVTNDDPVIYLRMDAPTTYTPPDVSTWPVLTNYGSAGGNGVYTPGTAPGIASGPSNPNGVPLDGVSGNSAALSGISSFADAGYDPAFDPTGPSQTLSVTAWFRGNPADNRFQTIIGHSDNSWRMALNTNGKLQFTVGSDTALNSTSVYNDGNWHQFVAVYDGVGGNEYLYVDGTLDNSAVVTGSSIVGSSDDVLIGSDPQYTNNPAGVGRQFAGQVCEVALFTNALTADQVQTLYNASGVAPYITGQPIDGGEVNGGSGTYASFSVTADGSSQLAYQWYFNTSSNYSGATKLVDNATHYLDSTTIQLTVTNLAHADSGYYFVVVTNNYGSVTSVLASLTVDTAPTINSQLPVPYTNLFTLFAGANPAFSVSTAGAQPIAYYWFTNGVLDAAATNSDMVWSNVSTGFITNYCVVSNHLGSVTSSVWTASVIEPPTAPYPTNVLAANPIGYWRLNEPDDGNGDGNPGVISLDYAGGNDGIYTNVILGNSGYSSTDPSDTSAEFGEYGSSFFDNKYLINNYAGQVQGIDFATPAGSNAEFTVEAWANGNTYGAEIVGGAIATKGMYGVDDEFNLGIDSTLTHYRFYVRDASGAVHVVGSGSSPTLDGNWHHIVGVCDEANGQLLLYFDGKLANTTAIPTNSGVYEASEPMTIGAGTADGVNYTNQFDGYINDVAIYNYALSLGQITAQYSSVAPGGVQPYFTQKPPAIMTVNAGDTLVLPAAAAGSTPLGCYWTDVNGGTNVAAGVTNGLPLDATLTVSNVPAAWNNDQLELTVTNASGSTNVYVTFTVYTNAPQITQDLPPNVIVPFGKPYTYSIDVVGPTPYGYQWYNVTTPVPNHTNSTYTVTAGNPGASTTYFVVITNIYGATTSSVSTFTSIAQLTNSYAANILQFNPVGYWPLQETNAPAAATMETNYGTLGALGNAYYAATNASNVAFNQSGALTGDSDPAVGFSGTGANADSYAFVPRVSPALTIQAPFTLECWVNPSDTVYGVAIGEGGGTGLNGGANFGGWQMGLGLSSG
ncbi:MAG: LamG-like jellyroll fold domain-containing protein, partial [Limisphaerales bacterium]